MNLTKTDQQLFEISKRISFFVLTPTNLKTEKQKFFSNKTYNPHFVYEPYKTNLELVRKELQNIKTDNSVIGKLLDEKRQYFINTLALIASRGHNSFTKASIRIYNQPDLALLKKAKQIVHFKTHPEEKKLTTAEVIKKLNYALVKYGVHWTVKEKDMVAFAAVSPTKKVLLVKKNAYFSEKFLKRLIVHEIGTHIIRAENGLKQPYKIFFYGLAGYLATEEGLCVLNEQLNGCLSNVSLKNYAGRVLAIHYALNTSFRNTFNQLRVYFNDDLAWKLTVRAKRGLGNTSLPGAFTKDLVYLKGCVAVKEYWYKHKDLTKLYYGRIGLEHVHLLPKIPNLVHPKYLPTLRYLNYTWQHFATFWRELIRSL